MSTERFLVVLTTGVYTVEVWCALHVCDTQAEADEYVAAFERATTALRKAAERRDGTFDPYGGWDEAGGRWTEPLHPLAPFVPLPAVLHGARLHVERIPADGLWRQWLTASSEDCVAAANAAGAKGR